MIRLVHHHLRRGGVTRVMVRTAEILRDAGEAVQILAGEAPSEPLPEGIGFQLMPGMGYEDPSRPTDPAGLADQLAALYREGDLWHIHNHSLGKNPAVSDAWIRLAERGQRMVLQPHDFAEDGRPANLARLREVFPGFPDRLYPVAPHVRYAVLQDRDRRILVAAGVPPGWIQVLPNPVAEEAFAPPRNPPERVLYLTRAIRRKNLGEFLLWARRHAGEFEFATSLRPENPAEREGFELWRAFAEREGIPVRWGTGAQGASFREVVEGGDVCITTSVGEGFGMSFLEPYAMGRRVCGRDLPGITAGFVADGVDLSHLYAELPVPVEAVDGDFWGRAVEQLGGWRRRMGVPAPLTEAELRQAWVREGRIDFGRLDESAQRAVLRAGVVPENGLAFGAAGTLDRNRAAIRSAYSPDRALNRLRALYGDVAEPGPLGAADGGRVRDAFLDPAAVFLLRT